MNHDEARRSLESVVRFSENPMRPPVPEAPSYGDVYGHFDGPPMAATSTGFAASGAGSGNFWMTRVLVRLLPGVYFKPALERKLPVAPPRLVLAGFSFEVAAVAAVFSAMCWYFRTSPTQQTTITLAPLPGQTCSVLNPKKDTIFYSAEHSENAQFASPYMTSTECVSLLTQLDVCGDGKRLDHVTLWGVSNPNTTHYYSGGQGYLSFTPTQMPGLATQLVPFFQPSVSFPKPDISRPTFLGSDSNWYLFNFANNTAADAFSSFRGVPASTFLYDARTNIVYDPTPKNKKLQANGAPEDTRQRDYDLSSSSPNANKEDEIGAIGKAVVGFDVVDIGVNSGVYYGLRGAATFHGPANVAVDAAGNLFLADNKDSLVRKIDAKTQAVTSLGTSASPAFSGPTGVAVDKDGNVFVSDNDNNLVRKIAASDGAVTSLGTSASPAFNGPCGVAVDADGNVFVADSNNNLLRRIDVTTQTVTNLGTSASPAFSRPTGVAVDAAGNLFVTDYGNNLMRKIDATTQAVTSLGTSAIPAFNEPKGVAVDAAGNLLVADSGNNLVRRIDATTQAVTSMGTSANPAFEFPYGVAADAADNVIATDYHKNLVRRIDASTHAVTRFVGAPRVLSWDMQSNPDPSSFTLWPDTALSSGTHNSHISVVDSAVGGCQNVGHCYLLAHAEVSPADGRLYLEFHAFEDGAYYGITIFYILDPAKKSKPMVASMYITTGIGSSPSRLLWGVIHTPANGTVLLTSLGAAEDTPDSDGYIQIRINSIFTVSVTAPGTSIVDASAIPSKIPGEEARFLLLTLREKGLNSVHTYDAFTDSIASSNAAAAATTHAMLAFTWGVCDGSVTRRLVELSFSNAYSNECPLPKTGLYYQSPNVYYAIPYACLGIGYDKLLTDCAEIRANMKAIVDASCQASIAKVCRQQYDLNPPFSCVTDVYPSALTVISLSSANATTLATFLAVVVAALLARTHRHYRPSEQDIAMVNAPPFIAAFISDVDAKSDEQPSVSGTGPGIEMLPSSGRGSHGSTDGMAAPAAAHTMHTLQTVHSVQQVQGAQQRRLDELEAAGAALRRENAQILQLVRSLSAQLQEQQEQQQQPSVPTSFPHLPAPSHFQASSAFDTLPAAQSHTPALRPSQQRPSWSAETLSYDEGHGAGGRL